MKKEKLLIVGFGDLGHRLVKLIDTTQYEICGICRNKRNMPTGVEGIYADARDSLQMRSILANNHDVVVVTLTPDERNDANYRRSYVDSVKLLCAQLRQRQPRLIIFVSSTRVYAQNCGEIVDEKSPTEPREFAGRRLLEAEQVLLDSGLNSCVVRFSGIYGRGEGHLLKQVKAGIGCPSFPAQYSNRIHADDCAGVLAHLIDLQRREALAPVYLATDCEPVSLWELKCWLARQLGLEEAQLSQSGDLSRQAGSKRCSNQLLLSTGYQFRYPSFRDGYRKVIGPV